MGILRKFFNQTRKPEGTLGNMMLSSMNSGHAKLADWGFGQLPEIKPENITDLGCGAGRNAAELLKKYPEAHVTALDYSPLSAEKTKEYNKEAVSAGRCTVRIGDVSDLSLPEESFDLATAFETVYFWPDIGKCFGNVAGILKKGGLFLICNESDGNDPTSKKFEGIIDGMKCYTEEKLEAALKKVGFSEVTGLHHPGKPWLCVIAKK